MTVELVMKPEVHVIAHTVIKPTGLERWADAHGLSPLLDTAGTPLAFLYRDSFDARNSLDALPEFGGRFCYRSWEKGRPRDEYLANIIEEGHGSVLHHSTVSFAVSGVSRSLSLELLRHHAGADPSQESQRYVDAKDVRFVVPPLVDALAGTLDGNEMIEGFREDCANALAAYNHRVGYLTGVMELVYHPANDVGIKLGTMRKKRILEAARAHLPNCAETRLLWTMNLRAARYVCALRGAEFADLEIRRLAVVFTRELKKLAPHVFHDFGIYTAVDGFEAVRCDNPKV